MLLYDCYGRVTGNISTLDVAGYAAGCRGRGEHVILRRNPNATQSFHRVWLLDCAPGTFAEIQAEKEKAALAQAQTLRAREQARSELEGIGRGAPVTSTAAPTATRAAPSVSRAPQFPPEGGIRSGSVYIPISDSEWSKILQRGSISRPEIGLKFQLRSFPKGMQLTQAMQQGRSLGNAMVQEGEGALIRTQSPGDACMILVDAWNNAVPVRPSANGLGRYGFVHPIDQAVAQARLIDSQAPTQEASLTEAERKRALTAAFTKHPGNQGGRCVAPPMGKVPPAPPKPDLDRIRMESNGICVYQIGSSFSASEVQNALASKAKIKERRDFQKWQTLTNNLECTQIEFSQVGRTLCRGATIFGTFGQDALNECILNQILACSRAAQSNCTADYDRWQRSAGRIRSKPREVLRDCEKVKRELAGVSEDKIRAQAASLEAFRTKRAQATAAAAPFTSGETIALSDRRTYCTP